MICQIIKRFACSRWMQCEARSQVNQGESEGVDLRPPMRDNLSSYVCKKIVKKVDNQQKMIQKGVLLSCSYSRSVMLLPKATPDKCPSRCLLS